MAFLRLHPKLAILLLGVAAVVATVVIGTGKSKQMNDKQLTILMGSSKRLPFADSNSTKVSESFLSMVLGQLVYASGAFEVEPGLVSSWQYDPAAHEYVLSLGSSIRFQNGRLVTSADLEYSLVRHLIGSYGSWFRSFFSNIDGVADVADGQAYKPGLVRGIRVIDSRRVGIRLRAPNPSFLHSLARSSFSLVPMEEMKADGTTWKQWPVGAGPYRIVHCNEASGTVDLAATEPVEGAPTRIKVLMNGDSSNADLSLVGKLGAATEIAKLQLPSFVTLFNFNFTSARMRDPEIRARVRGAIKSDSLEYDSLELRPTEQLLPKHFWGRATVIPSKQVRIMETKMPLNILVFDSGSNSPTFFSFLETLKSQLQEANFEPDIRFTGDKYSKPPVGAQNDVEISSLGSDVMDPLVMFSAFRSGSPLAPYIPQEDDKFEALISKAEMASGQEERELTVTAVANYFEQQNYTVPLFERFSTIAFNPSTIASLGKQNGSIILYVERIKLK